MLTVELDNLIYFIDVGSGWASTKLFPADKPTEYSIYGMTFKTELSNDTLLLYHKTEYEFKQMITIPLKSKPENEILIDIENRYKNIDIYPFRNSLRFSKVIGNEFYFLKGNRLRIYSESQIVEKTLSLNEIYNLIISKFNFNLSDLNIDFIA